MIALSTISITAIESVSEEERQHHRDRDRREVTPAERRGDDEAEHLADGAAGQTVRRRA
jgi:hypothetical protein